MCPSGKGLYLGELVEKAAFRNFFPKLGGHEFLVAGTVGICKALYLGNVGFILGTVFTNKFIFSLFSPIFSLERVSGMDSWTFMSPEGLTR